MSAVSSPNSPITPVFRCAHKETARWDAERDTDTLFQNHSVEEIRKIERTTRKDIQLKKEELRQMVGERYRDLIGAADSITDMMRCCKQASDSLNSSQHLSSALLQTHKLKGTGPIQLVATQSHELMCAAVSQMKLLVGIQGKIWGSIDAMDYEQAVEHFLWAKHIVTGLCLESIVHQKSVLDSVAVILLEQWTLIKHFQATILDCCRQNLKSVNLECSAFLHSLVAMVTLDHISIREVFNEFLIGRKAAIVEVFHPSRQGASVKSQLCQLVTIIRSSLQLTALLFCRSSLQEHSRILVSINNNLQSLQEAGLEVPATPTEIEQSTVQSSYKEWLGMCTAELETGMTRLLHHIMSVKAVSSIREAIHDVLSQTCDDEMDWDDACNVVMGRKFCVWKELLQPLIFARAKVLLQGNFSKVESSFADVVRGFIDQSQCKDKSSFLWSEEDEVLGVSLTLKATGCTPHVYKFCTKFSTMLAAIVDEVNCYTTPGEKIVDKPSSAFDKYEDNNEMYGFIQERALQLTNSFLVVISELRPTVMSLDSERLLLLGQLCQGLQQHCPLLTTLSQGCRPVKLRHPLDRIGSTGRAAGDLDKVNRHQSNKVTELLHQMFTSIYREWCEWTAAQITERFSVSLLSNDDPFSCAVLNWEEVKISEETEGGNAVESVIRVPAQASCFVTNLLFVLCQQLAAIRGHSIDKELLLHIGHKLLKNVLDIYDNLLHNLQHSSSQSLQNCALQILFDVKFLSNLLPHSSMFTEQEVDLTAATQDIVMQLENFIDPFDLDVFMPHLVQNLDRHYQRCSVMLGSISSLGSSPHVKLKGSRVAGVRQEKHNVMPVAPSVAAFTSLPVLTTSLSQATPIMQDTVAPLSIIEQMNFLLS